MTITMTRRTFVYRPHWPLRIGDDVMVHEAGHVFPGPLLLPVTTFRVLRVDGRRRFVKIP